MPTTVSTMYIAGLEREHDTLERMHDKLRAAVGGQTDEPEHLLDVLIAAWEEVHREAKVSREAIDAAMGAIRDADFSKAHSTLFEARYPKPKRSAGSPSSDLPKEA